MTPSSGPSLAEQWAAGLVQVMEAMADARPEYRCSPMGSAAASEDTLWWAQPFSLDPEAMVWVGARTAAWEDLGGRTLRAAGLEDIQSVHARNTWLEILSQSLAVAARGLGEVLNREVDCANGSEQEPPDSGVEWHEIALTYPNATQTLQFVVNVRLLQLLVSGAGPVQAHDEQDGASLESAPELEVPGPSLRSRTMALLLDVELPVSISFGKAQLPMKDVLKLTTGSIVELNRGVGEPVEVLVNQCLIARGEVVVVDGNYGVRIQQIVSPQERLRSLR